MESPRQELPVKYPAKVLVVDVTAHKVLILQLEGGEREKRGIEEWHVPGGSFEAEVDENLEATGVREVAEEVGLRVTIIKRLGEAAWDAYYEGEPTHFEASFFLAELAQDPLEAVIDRSEADALAWVDESTMNNYPGLTPEARKFIPIALEAYSL